MIVDHGGIDKRTVYTFNTNDLQMKRIFANWKFHRDNASYPSTFVIKSLLSSS